MVSSSTRFFEMVGVGGSEKRIVNPIITHVCVVRYLVSTSTKKMWIDNDVIIIISVARRDMTSD